MGLEQALTQGLLGMVGGGAKVIQDQEKADRENAAKSAEDAARSERDMAIEERRSKLGLANQKEIAGINHANRIDEIKAQKDPNEAKLNALKLQQATDDMKVPKAVQMEYDALKKQNETISSAIYKAQAEGTYDKEAAANAEKAMSENTKRMGELLSNQPGYVERKGKGAFDPSQYKVGGAEDKSAVNAKQTAMPQQSAQVTPTQRLDAVKAFISGVNTRDSMSLAAARTKLAQMKKDPAYQFVDIDKLASNAGIRL